MHVGMFVTEVTELTLLTQTVFSYEKRETTVFGSYFASVKHFSVTATGVGITCCKQANYFKVNITCSSSVFK